MKLFSSLRQQATDFLAKYKSESPATYAAAEQAIGAVLVADGFFGVAHPFSGQKRPGIFGAFVGIFVGIIFMLFPIFFGQLTGTRNMTANTTATVISVNPGSGGGACAATVQYTVNGQTYTPPSSFASSGYCSLAPGQIVQIKYNPTNPGSWATITDSFTWFPWIFFAAGLISFVSSLITFFIRLFSIIFGWKLLRDGRKNAASLPAGTDLQTIIDEIKRNFTSSIFGFENGTGNIPQPPNIQL